MTLRMMKPVVVWSADVALLQAAYDEAVELGFPVSQPIHCDGWSSFHIHAERALPTTYRKWLARGVCWLQVQIEKKESN